MWSEKLNLAVGSLSGLKVGEYASLGVLNLTAPTLLDVVLALSITPGNSDGERHVMLFARVSFDGLTWTGGPGSGAKRDDEPVLYQIDRLALNTPHLSQRKCFSLDRRMGFLPPYVEIIVLNSSGDTLPETGHDAGAYLRS